MSRTLLAFLLPWIIGVCVAAEQRLRSRRIRLHHEDHEQHHEHHFRLVALNDTKALEAKRSGNATAQQRHLENSVGDIFFTPRIINGQASQAGEHPYFATRWSSSFICGASLVAPDILITAAHCENSFTNDALVGALFRDSTSNGAQVVRVTAKIPHPDYFSSVFAIRNDIMVLKISPPVNDKQLIRMNLNRNLPRSGQRLTAIGMGKLSDRDGDFPSRLMETQVFETTEARCRQSWGDIADIFICAWDESPLKTVCGGDSGSALIDQSNGAIVGLVSFGSQSCTDGLAPAAFTRISAYRNWLTKTICAQSANPPNNLNCNSNSCRKVNQDCNNAGQCCGNRLKCSSNKKCVRCALKNKRCNKNADCCTKGARCHRNTKRCTK